MITPSPLVTVDNIDVLTSSAYGWRVYKGRRVFHKGTDLRLQEGTPVRTMMSGVVLTSRYDTTAGYFVRVDHGNGVHTRYLHLSRLDVKVGDIVAEGQQIGLSGNTGDSTGPHLHFELQLDVTPIGNSYLATHVDPVPYIKGGYTPQLRVTLNGRDASVPKRLQDGKSYVLLEGIDGPVWVQASAITSAWGGTIEWTQENFTATMEI